MATLLLFEDQLSIELVRQHRPDRMLLIESRTHFGSWRFHKIRIAFQCAALRHFAQELISDGMQVHYYGLDRSPYLDSLSAIKHLISTTGDRSLIVVNPSEYHTHVWVHTLGQLLGVDIRFESNTLFLIDREDFSRRAQASKSLLMEPFYRQQRKRLNVLMELDGTPTGGMWNLDKQNRKPAKKTDSFPAVPTYAPDSLTQSVLSDVERCFADHPGSTRDFALPTTRDDALHSFEDFLVNRLAKFGDYEDAMLTGQRVMYHAHVSMLLNAGLLDPMTMVRSVESQYRSGLAPLNSVEGFIRQIIGWREYVYGIYWSFMPDYRDRNARASVLDLPDWFWTANTQMNCLRQCISGVVDHAYSHHIQRLMVICNFATLAGLVPQAVNDWFYEMYVDSHDWVVTPNVVGMGMNADGGTMSTKPYVSSAAYINRMTDYCGDCAFDPTQRIGEKACPFNYLFWTFLHHFKDLYKKNPRMTMMLRNAEKIDPVEMQTMMQQRKQFIDLHVRGQSYPHRRAQRRKASNRISERLQ